MKLFCYTVILILVSPPFFVSLSLFLKWTDWVSVGLCHPGRRPPSHSVTLPFYPSFLWKHTIYCRINHNTHITTCMTFVNSVFKNYRLRITLRFSWPLSVKTSGKKWKLSIESMCVFFKTPTKQLKQFRHAEAALISCILTTPLPETSHAGWLQLTLQTARLQ